MSSRLRLAVIGLILFCVGCTTVPTAGPVESVPVSAPPRGVEIAPEPPQPGVSRARLIDGFLQAMADPEADYEVARQYLSVDAAESWQPESGAVVYDGFVSEADGAFAAVGTATGTLDELGRFTPTRTPLSFPFQLVQEGGEWRISRPPQGLLISRFIFERYYAHVTTYFMARSGNHVVPDVIHLPEAQLTPSRVVEAQLAGPSPAVARVVRNAIPAGTRLGPEGASLDADGTARVSLVGLPQELSEHRRRELGAQLVWSLTAIPRMSGLQVLNGSTPLALPGQGADGVLELASQQGYQVLSRATTPDLFGVRRGVAGRLSTTGAFVAMESANERVAEVAVSIDASLVAFVDESRSLVLIGPMGGQLTAVVPESGNIRSAQFVLGSLWVLADSPQGATQLMQIDSQGRITIVDTSGAGGPIVEFSISQVGARIALVTTRGGGRTFGMAALATGPEPRIESYSELLLADESNVVLSGFEDLSWSGETEIALIARAEENPSVYLVHVDGSLVEHLGPVGEVPVQITALPRIGGDAVTIRSEADAVRRYEVRTRWSPLGIELSSVSYPG